MKKQVILPFLFSVILFYACDPGLSGDSKVFNDSYVVLTISYEEYKNGKVDTVTKDLQPGEKLVISEFGGLGDKSKINCCPYGSIISVKSPNGLAKKQSSDCDSWTIPNKNKLKRHGKEPIKCEFHITQEDI